jgi:hypothetical protein
MRSDREVDLRQRHAEANIVVREGLALEGVIAHLRSVCVCMYVCVCVCVCAYVCVRVCVCVCVCA